MSPAATTARVGARRRPSTSKIKGWDEARSEIPSILIGSGQENASTARHNLEQGMDSGRKTSERPRSRSRANSVRHVKDSAEVVRQRSVKHTRKDVDSDRPPTTREGQQFTVANVGNNGKIYLRPSVRTQKSSNPPTAYPGPVASKPRHYDSDGESTRDRKRWSDTQTSRTGSRCRRTQSIGPTIRRSNSLSEPSPRLSRSNSVSTIGEGHNPATGAYRVTIDRNRSAAAQLQAGETSQTAIEVPIPHYRLGTPRFSTRGTAFLHSAVYSASSTHGDAESVISNPDVESLFPLPPGLEGTTAPPGPRSQAVPELHTVHMNPGNGARRLPIPTSTPVFHRSKEPITPSIYDAIAANPDNPAIVRYAIMSHREISAASPARIIAQITSKNFLDYELLSDFFLTVRAYLSTHDLLAYLLARFEWAINRFDDDGRVIRVRAFAAIRHWVLNYFPYDFVVDRDLRVKFCTYLNTLARHVRIRASHEPSDLKLVIDLKKCWNGRCALYWDNPESDVDGRNDSDISPGGIVGSRDSRLTHPSELWAKLATTSSQKVDQETSVAALHNWVDSVIEAEVDGRSKNDRQISTATGPTSPYSEQSVQPTSCTMPGRNLKAFASGQALRNPGSHPVPAAIPPTARKMQQKAAASPKVCKAGPKKPEPDRSGSFSDALRDKRTSLPMGADQSKEQVVVNVPFSGSLIRGSVFPPGSPFIDNLAPQGSTTALQRQGQYAQALDNTPLDQRPMSPGVRNLLANIRRAWSSKQTSSAQTAALLASAPFPAEKNAALPMHIAFKIEGLGDQYRQLEALKKNSRIDLLCADVTAMFEQAMNQAHDNPRPQSITPTASRNDVSQLPSSDDQRVSAPQREILTRNTSAMTYGSRSILIMDDTMDDASSEPPVPEVPRKYSEPTPAEYSMSSVQVPFTISDLSKDPMPEYETLIPPRNPSEFIAQAEGDTPHSELLPEFTIPSLPASPPSRLNATASQAFNRGNPSSRAIPSFTANQSISSNRSDSQSLRKYVSYQSGMRRSGVDHCLNSTTSASNAGNMSPGQGHHAPGRMLRRRPGGDLRANETVHDLAPISRPRSTGSITTYTDSFHNSLKRIPHTSPKFQTSHPNDAIQVRQPSELQKTPSMIHGETPKQELRPSFEAAVAEFARIPDDEGGDLEATLAKLEGKFRKSPVGSSEGSQGCNGTHAGGPFPIPDMLQDLQKPAGSKIDHKVEPCPGKDVMLEHPTQLDPDLSRDTMTRSLYADSEESYNSVPLLERIATNETHQGNGATSNKSQVTMPKPLFTPDLADEYRGIDPATDYEYQSSLRRGRYRSSVPTATTDSFLLDDDESLSDLSSDLSDDEYGTNPALEEAYGSAANQLGGRTLPPNVEYASGYLPSPPMTVESAMALKSEAHRIQEQRKPPTPEPSPISRHTDVSSRSRTPGEVDGAVLQPFANTVHQFPTRRHIPFPLAFDAVLLAQQFTLIERDALNEINWQDLIDMRWNNASSTTLNWVEYLRFQDPTGIELVTARFNVMVKWAQSEIVLTHSIEERALTIMKYIHIAQYARKIHNYATMLQLTIAMTSIDCTRLARTWALVPEADRMALKEMEKLVSPLRNFHNLRMEMDAEDLEDGCIPVVALFIHDLTYNAQKPSVIASTRDAEPLVNFERYRTTATIVKSLLRLIDASAKYDFRPVEGALERCLWVASLSDEGIRSKSRELEA